MGSAHMFESKFAQNFVVKGRDGFPVERRSIDPCKQQWGSWISGKQSLQFRRQNIRNRKISNTFRLGVLFNSWHPGANIPVNTPANRNHPFFQIDTILKKSTYLT